MHLEVYALAQDKIGLGLIIISGYGVDMAKALNPDKIFVKKLELLKKWLL